MENSFGQIVLFNILKNSFYTYLNDSCISWVFSWLFTWILILDWMTLWFLKLTWILILDLSLWHHQNKSGSFASTYLNPWFSVFLLVSAWQLNKTYKNKIKENPHVSKSRNHEVLKLRNKILACLRRKWVNIFWCRVTILLFSFVLGT